MPNEKNHTNIAAFIKHNTVFKDIFLKDDRCSILQGTNVKPIVGSMIDPTMVAMTESHCNKYVVRDHRDNYREHLPPNCSTPYTTPDKYDQTHPPLHFQI